MLLRMAAAVRCEGGGQLSQNNQQKLNGYKKFEILRRESVAGYIHSNVNYVL